MVVGMRVEEARSYHWSQIEQLLQVGGYDKNFQRLWAQWADSQQDGAYALVAVENDNILGICHAFVLDGDTLWMDEICIFYPEARKNIYYALIDYLADEMKVKSLSRLLSFIETPFMDMMEKVLASFHTRPMEVGNPEIDAAETAGLYQLACYANLEQEVDVGEYFLREEGRGKQHVGALTVSLYPQLVEPRGAIEYAFAHVMHALSIVINEHRPYEPEDVERASEGADSAYYNVSIGMPMDDEDSWDDEDEEDDEEADEEFPYILLTTLSHSEDKADWIASMEALKARIVLVNAALGLEPLGATELRHILQNREYALNQSFELWGKSLHPKDLRPKKRHSRFPMQ